MTAAFTNSDPLVVKPREACRLLACGRTRLYQLIAAREIDSFSDGGSRKITTDSLRRYVQRQLSVEGLAP
jgi:excisionase family DNA binding protein